MKAMSELLDHLNIDEKVKVAVVHANDEATLESIYDERIADYLEPYLIGDSTEIQKYLDGHNYQGEILHTDSEEESAALGVDLIREGKASILIKGNLPSGTFLKAVVDREKGIRKSPLLTHAVINEIPSYHKLIVTSDGGMVLEPSKEDKKVIIQHAVEVSRKLGAEKPKVAILSASEKVNPKMQSSVEAEELMLGSKEWGIPVEVDGPISLDLAMDSEIVKIKGYDSPVAGDADVLISPDIDAGNILGKSLTVFGGAFMAGLIMGAEAPIVMNSRGSSRDEKMYAIVAGLYISKE